MFPQKIRILNQELELVKQRGRMNRAYRLVTSSGNVDFTFREDYTEDSAHTLEEIKDTVYDYLKKEGLR